MVKLLLVGAWPIDYLEHWWGVNRSLVIVGLLLGDLVLLLLLLGHLAAGFQDRLLENALASFWSHLMDR